MVLIALISFISIVTISRDIFVILLTLVFGCSTFLISFVMFDNALERIERN